jgi:hypothetical protein
MMNEGDPASGNDWDPNHYLNLLGSPPYQATTILTDHHTKFKTV